MLHFKDILILALSTLIAIGAYLIKGFLKDIRTMQKDIEGLKQELSKVEIESKRYWSEHKIKMENNHKILLEKINNIQDNHNRSENMLKDMFERIENRLDRIEK